MNENVFLLKLTPGLKPDIIDIIIEEGYEGIIIESYGLGGLPNTEGNDFGSKIKSAIEKGNKIVILVNVLMMELIWMFMKQVLLLKMLGL